MAAKPTMVFTPSPWPQLDELLSELEAVASSPRGGIEPSLSQATLAVSKATVALTRAAGRRVRGGQAALETALELVEEARQAVAHARLAIAATEARSGTRPRGPAPVAGRVGTFSGVQGDVETTCPVCQGAFVVRYQAIGPHPVVVFPVACPAPGCDGMSDVEYPVTAIRVDVRPITS